MEVATAAKFPVAPVALPKTELAASWASWENEIAFEPTEKEAGFVPEQVIVVQETDITPLLVKAPEESESPVPKRLLKELPLMMRLVVLAVAKEE